MLSTARDLYRWNLALDGNDVFDAEAKRLLFTPYVREEPGGDTSYGYGWVIQQTGIGTVAGHDGGNAWSYGELYRLIDADVSIFWVTNRYRDAAVGWNLSRRAPAITRGVARALLAG